MSVTRAVKETVSKALRETGVALKYASGEEVRTVMFAMRGRTVHEKVSA